MHTAHTLPARARSSSGVWTRVQGWTALLGALIAVLGVGGTCAVWYGARVATEAKAEVQQRQIEDQLDDLQDDVKALQIDMAQAQRRDIRTETMVETLSRAQGLQVPAPLPPDPL